MPQKRNQKCKIYWIIIFYSIESSKNRETEEMRTGSVYKLKTQTSALEYDEQLSK